MTAQTPQTATRRDEITVSSMVLPALRTTLVPASTRSTLNPIGVLISRAAAVLRCATLRTLLATTAKPRPCSPALAISRVYLQLTVRFHGWP